MHRVYLGEVAAQRAARAHLDAPDRVQVAGGLRERRVAGGLARVLQTTRQRVRKK